MDPTLSISKGVFVFKNGATRSKARGRPRSSKNNLEVSSLLGKEITDKPYYKTFKKTWNSLKSDINRIHEENYVKTLQDIVNFVASSYENNVDNILPTAALLTGINQPDHHQQFEALLDHIQDESAGICSILEARNCSNMKTTVESLVSGFIDGGIGNYDEDNHEVRSLRRGQYTMHVLESWYQAEYPDGNETLVVIAPGFESFNIQILQDLIVLLQSYCDRVPIVFILGVATAISSLHSSLPYHVTSRMRLKVFQLQSAITGLNNIIEEVILSPYYKFRLSGKVFTFLTDTFLFYDFSINGFVQGVKYCLMEHFHQGSVFSLCDEYFNSLEKIEKFTHRDFETIRQFPSFRPYVESFKSDPEEIVALLTDDKHLKKRLPALLKECHKFLLLFRCFLEFITKLVQNLPRASLGRLCREVYSRCVSSKVTDLPEFKECWQMISFLSKNEFVAKITSARNRTKKFTDENLSDGLIENECREVIYSKLSSIDDLMAKVVNAGMASESTPTEEQVDLSKFSRHELKDKLLELSKKEKPVSDYTKAMNETMDFVKNEIISKHLLPFTTSGGPPLLELFVFSDLWLVRQHIVGAPRAALHSALNDPHQYLQCSCCELKNTEDLLATMPDICVAYKLHLESGRMINAYDWLQAFRYVVDSNHDDESEEVDPKIQARFTRAVAELQFLGYIKTSKKKTDHVTRLTW